MYDSINWKDENKCRMMIKNMMRTSMSERLLPLFSEKDE